MLYPKRRKWSKSKEMQSIFIRGLFIISLVIIGYLLIPFVENILLKMGFGVVHRIFRLVFLKMGNSCGLALAILYLIREILAISHSFDNGEGSAGGRGAPEERVSVTELFASGHSNGSSSSSENSVNNQEEAAPAPAPAPAPVPAPAPAPQAWIPEDPENQHLISAQQRMEELTHRLTLNSLKKNWSNEQWGNIIAAQITFEESVERTLLEDGFSQNKILQERHKIRGFLFYPEGSSLAESTYVGYVNCTDTRNSAPFRRVLKAIKEKDLDI